MKATNIPDGKKKEFLEALEKSLSERSRPCRMIHHKCIYYDGNKISIPKQIKGGTLLSFSTTSFDYIREAMLQFKSKIEYNN